MSAITSRTQILTLLSQVVPQQDLATLRSPGQPALEGTFFAPERRSIPFLSRSERMRPRPGVPLEARISGEAGTFRFFTQLFAFEGSGRLRLALPATIEVQALAQTQVPENTQLEIEIGGSWIAAPLVSLDPTGVTFVFSALVSRLTPRRRVRGRLILGGGPPAPVVVEVSSVQVAPGTGERLAHTRFLMLPTPAATWLKQACGDRRVA